MNSKATSEFHPSISAVGSHLDEKTGHPDSPVRDFLRRAERTLEPLSASVRWQEAVTEEEMQIEEAMHLGR